MARGINKVIIIGNLGADPEVRYTPNGNAVTNLNIATTTNWRDRQSGEMQEKTEWHRIVMFNRLAEVAGEYLKKGSKIYIDGSLRTRKWQDKNGQDRYTTEIIANEMQMLDSRSNSMGGSNNYDNFDSNSQSNNHQQNNIYENNQTPATGSSDNFDDDIPF